MKRMNSLILFFVTTLFIGTVILLHGNIDILRPQCCSHPIFSMNKIIYEDNVIPIVILGSGPAGLSAAIYGARSMKKTLVLEGNKPGGLLSETTWVENWPGIKKQMGPDIIESVKSQAEMFGAQFVQDVVEQVDFSRWPFVLYTESGKKLHALTVIIATGASPRLLHVPGELEYWGKGVTTCAICDAPFFKNEDVVVIGGGDSAAEEAIQLAPYAKSVTILVRKKSMRAAKSMQELLKGYANISIKYNLEVQEIQGDGTLVTGIKVYDNKANKAYEMPIAGVFLAIGHIPNSTLFENFLAVDQDGYIEVKAKGQQTSIPGVYAAGDVTDKLYRQAGVAAGDGIKAALDADRFLSEQGFNDEIAQQITGPSYSKKKINPIISTTSLDHLEAIISKGNPVMVDFYADYCPTCMHMLPIFEEIAHSKGALVKFVKVDAGNESTQELLEKYQVFKVPCLLVFNEGQLVARYNSTLEQKELRKIADSY